LKELSVDQYNFAKDLGNFIDNDYSANFKANNVNADVIIDEDRYYFEPISE
jgi:hypothetical protein